MFDHRNRAHHRDYRGFPTHRSHGTVVRETTKTTDFMQSSHPHRAIVPGAIASGKLLRKTYQTLNQSQDAHVNLQAEDIVYAEKQRHDTGKPTSRKLENNLRHRWFLTRGRTGLLSVFVYFAFLRKPPRLRSAVGIPWVACARCHRVRQMCDTCGTTEDAVIVFNIAPIGAPGCTCPRLNHT